MDTRRILTMRRLTLLLLVAYWTTLPCIDAYETVELYRYCRRQSSSNSQFQEVGRFSQNIESGLVIPEYNTKSEDSEETLTVHSLVDGSVVKNIVVDSTSDASAVRILFSKSKNRSRQRNGQYCALYVSSAKPTGLIITIRRLKLRSGVDWLRLLINNGSFVREFSHVKIEDDHDTVAYVATQGVMIELKTGHSIVAADNDQIEFTVTAFREADICHIKEFDCGSFRCISSDLFCDGVNNCGDGRDEVSCPDKNVTMYIIITGILVLVTLLLSACVTYRCCCADRKPRRPFQYVKLQTGSNGNGITPIATAPQLMEHTIDAHPDMIQSQMRHNSVTGDQIIRRFKLSAVPSDSLSAIPSSPDVEYGSTGNTYLLPAYATVHLGSNNYGLVPSHQIFGPGTSRLVSLGPGVYNGITGRPRSFSTQTGGSGRRSHHYSVPLPQSQPYPSMHPQLFQPPPQSKNTSRVTSTTPLTPAPPPYTPRDETPSNESNGDAGSNKTNNPLRFTTRVARSNSQSNGTPSPTAPIPEEKP